MSQRYDGKIHCCFLVLFEAQKISLLLALHAPYSIFLINIAEAVDKTETPDLISTGQRFPEHPIPTVYPLTSIFLQ
jgi:hypothetical protein